MPSAPHSDDSAIQEERAARDAEAELYDQHRDLLRWEAEAIDSCLERFLQLEPTHRVVDAGCGTGAHLPWLLDSAASVIGVDHSARSLAVARRRLTPEQVARVELLEGDVRSLPIGDRAADRLLSSEVIHHLPSAETRLEAAREFFRVLKPGGLAAIVVYRWLGHAGWRRNGVYRTEHGGIPFHAFTAGELGRLLRQAGFGEVAIVGAAILPGISKRLRIGAEPQARLAFAPLTRHLADYLVARAVRPAA
jgi:ubiquinone/menaquinone biosynthesis C-methylase UbiE